MRLLCLIVALWSAGPLLLASEPPSLENILKNLVAASGASQLQLERNSFAFRRNSEVDYLNPDGNTRSQVVRVYEVKPADGKPSTKLVSINGKPATESDENHSNARQTGEKSRRLEFNEDLVGRYKFTLGPPQVINGRPVFVVYFFPKAGAPSNAFLDKLINAMFGTLYIDQEDFQFVKADAHLSQKVSFFGGIAGAIEHLDLSIVQRRLEPGVWLPELTLIDFSGRKLLSDLKFRCIESCAEFRKTAEPIPGATLEKRVSRD